MSIKGIVKLELSNLRVLIVSDNATDEFGGEAILPLHYFQFLKKAGVKAWLITHERVRGRLEEILGDDINYVFFMPETGLFKFIHKIGQNLSPRVRGITTGFIMQILTLYYQRRITRQMVKNLNIDVVHEPAPVSPKKASSLFFVGCPVVIGPMNGGMNFPDDFKYMQSTTERFLYSPLRLASHLLNILIPGKVFAKVLLVANERSKKALPLVKFGKVLDLVENGVDLDLWNTSESRSDPTIINFIYVGRLVDWKCVDVLIDAFKQLDHDRFEVRLLIVGEGEDKVNLIRQAGTFERNGKIEFLGWMSQQQVTKVLSKSDILVLPSVRECGGAVVLEAMALKKPVIAIDWGGPADYIDDETGILLKPVKRELLVDSMGNAMNFMLTNKKFRLDAGQKGFKKVSESFSWQNKIKEIIKIYTSLVDKNQD